MLISHHLNIHTLGLFKMIKINALNAMKSYIIITLALTSALSLTNVHAQDWEISHEQILNEIRKKS